MTCNFNLTTDDRPFIFYVMNDINLIIYNLKTLFNLEI